MGGLCTMPAASAGGFSVRSACILDTKPFNLPQFMQDWSQYIADKKAEYEKCNTAPGKFFTWYDDKVVWEKNKLQPTVNAFQTAVANAASDPATALASAQAFAKCLEVGAKEFQGVFAEFSLNPSVMSRMLMRYCGRLEHHVKMNDVAGLMSSIAVVPAAAPAPSAA